MQTLTMIFIVLFCQNTLAHEELHESAEQRVLKEVDHKGAKVRLIVKEGGHLLGQPFHVQLQAQCPNLKNETFKVQDSFTVCDMDPQSVVINDKKTALAMKVKMADIANYNDQISLGLSSPQVKCLEKTVIKKFSLKTVCK